MGKPLFCIVGETGAGKSTILNYLTMFSKINISNLVYNTTRTKRDNELEGVDYNFIDRRLLSTGSIEYNHKKFILDIHDNTKIGELDNNSIDKYDNKSVIEYRKYNTKNNGVSYYYTTIKNIKTAMSKGDVLICSASVDQAISYMRILEKARICDVYFIILECSAAERIKRVLDRDSSDKAVLELCRRILDEREEFNKIYDLGLENKKYITINTGNGIEISSCADIINDFISSKIS